MTPVYACLVRIVWCIGAGPRRLGSESGNKVA